MLHHDHLANYARALLLRRLRAQGRDVEHSRLWQVNAADLKARSLIRFEPRYICEKCNNGDGRGKDPNYRGRVSRMYPKSFSMNPQELLQVSRGSCWDTAASRIWRSARHEHRRRRLAISWWVQSIIEAEATC
ncbi:hypothetical protein [Sphingomonas sp. S2-65]|uniref:hypothetical protein n=1 Tax=Sphingomonas sp. S2-65 TaxID=2903960 RepID=UPI001F492D08|nr:hypothetical protein [Sphingomonas sp. S2-65]UYY58107.1 hypothetical protein LZ586_15795 [Sphingomonas sp. S2-65]